GRYGQGVIAARLGKSASMAGLMTGKTSQTGLVRFAQAAARNVRIGEVPLGKRAAAGQAHVPVKAGDRIIGVTPLVDRLEFWKDGSPPSGNGADPAPKERRPARTRTSPASQTRKPAEPARKTTDA